MTSLPLFRFLSLITIAVFSNLIITGLSHAKSPVYKISKGDEHLYIGGTIHLLAEHDYPLPAAFDIAFNDSDDIFFEIDMQQMQNLSVQKKLAPLMLLPEGKTLKTELAPATYQRLARFLQERNTPIILMERITPVGLSITLVVIELQRLGLGNPNAGVDVHYTQRTIKANKERDFLETIDEQIGFLEEFKKVDPNELLESSMNDLMDFSEKWKSAIQAWRQGELDVMSESLNAHKMQSDYPAIYKLLLHDRNQRWLTKIKPMLESKDVEFILVGALHLQGKDGLIQRLANDGYRVEQLD